MALDADPYRVLGLSRGASLDEVKRAYRRLAKANHPDAAGAGALPRFLAIQAAYERLTGGPAAASTGGRATPTPRRRRDGGGAPGRRPNRGGSAGPAGPAGRAGPSGRTRPPGPGGPGATADTGGSGTQTGAARGKATLGSTSYDGADAGPFEPDWAGASWYGTTSGTYWTINPKEYADPRKHGPEYQARARRATPAPDPAPAAADRRPADSGGAAHRVDSPAPDPARAAIDLGRALTDPASGGLRGRVIRAVLGWLPVALGLGWLIGELTGCGRFAATCDPSAGPLTAGGQVIFLALLLLLPEVAAIAAGAALVVLGAAIAVSLVLSATGAAADEASRRTALGGLILVAWLGGVVVALVRRVRSGSPTSGPVS